MLPRLVKNVTWVPLCGGVPAGSITWATICAVPFNPSVDVAVVRLMTEPEGASRGTFSQPTAALRMTSTPRRKPGARKRDTMRPLNILVPMNLAGQAACRKSAQGRSAQNHGYAMVALLV